MQKPVYISPFKEDRLTRSATKRNKLVNEKNSSRWGPQVPESEDNPKTELTTPWRLIFYLATTMKTVCRQVFAMTGETELNHRHAGSGDVVDRYQANTRRTTSTMGY